ncbi:hypothetical protein [Sphingomonas elodea]|uniref:hypothetical protein n=1 Tax=Sphingomonas elodea TaxID=179878 RepID=UPI000263106A|nr:hypothetical protein [Sphingomonas elodea]
MRYTAICSPKRRGGWVRRSGDLAIWRYCLMPNHVDMVMVPADKEEPRHTFADAHRRYTGYINACHRWTGHRWQGRFGAVVMNEAHLGHAMRQVEPLTSAVALLDPEAGVLGVDCDDGGDPAVQAVRAVDVADGWSVSAASGLPLQYARL